MKFDGNKFLEKHGKSIGKNIKIYVGFIMFMVVLMFGFVGWNFISMRSDFDKRFKADELTPHQLTVEIKSLRKQLDWAQQDIKKLSKKYDRDFLDFKKDVRHRLSVLENDCRNQKWVFTSKNPN